MKQLFITVFTIIIMLATLNGITDSDYKSLWKRDYFTGDWGGLRSRLEKKGITIEIVHTGEMVGILTGGTQKKNLFLDNKDIILSMNVEKLLGWKGADFSFYLLGNHGDSPSEYVGDLQVLSNIETYSTWKLYEAWYQQKLFKNKLSLKIGLYDLNSEFDIIESGGIFHNSSFGIGPDFSQSGINGPSIFATTSLGIRFRYEPSESYYVQAVFLDGVPGDPNDSRGTHIILKRDDGLLISGEVGYRSDKNYYRKLALGVWTYTSNTVDISFNDPMKTRKNKGLYILAEQQIIQEKEDKEQGLIAFIRLGTADRRVNQLGFYFGIGLVYKGLFTGRKEDQIGIGLAYAHNSKFYMKATNYGVNRAETALELVYHFQAAPWLAIKPEFQYIINPGTTKEIKNTLVFGIRSEISF